MLKLLESPYDPFLELGPESEECVVEKPLDHKEGSQTTTEKNRSLKSADLMRHYLSKPPEWSLSLCVT